MFSYLIISELSSNIPTRIYHNRIRFFRCIPVSKYTYQGYNYIQKIRFYNKSNIIRENIAYNYLMLLNYAGKNKSNRA